MSPRKALSLRWSVFQGETQVRQADLAAANFDGDSRLDVVVAMNRGLNVMWGHDDWGTTQHRPITEAGEHRFVATGDYDNDGQIDVVASMYNTNSNLRAYFGSIPETGQ